MSAIAQLIIEQGRQAAAAREAQGAVWGRAIDNVSQVPAQVMAQQRQNQELAMQHQELQQRLALQGQQQQMNAQTMAEHQTGVANQGMVDKILGSDIYNKEDGTIDVEKATALAEAGGMPHVVPMLRDQANKWNSSAIDYQAKKETARKAALEADTMQATQLGDDAAGLQKANYDPGMLHAYIAKRTADGFWPKAQGDAMLAQIQDPAAAKALIDQWATQRPPEKPLIQPEGATVIRPNPQGPATIISPATSKPKDEFQTFKESYPQTLGLKTWDALSPAQQTNALGVYAQTKADPAMRAVALSNAELAGAMRKLQIGQQPTPEDAEATADTILKHQLAPSQMATMFGGFGGAAFKRMVGNAAMKKDPNFDWEQAESDYQFGKTPGFQNTVRLMGSIQESLPRLQQTADSLANTNIRFVNGIANLTKDQLNNPTLKAFQTDSLFVADEAAKILQGGGTGNATSDNKLTQAQKVFRDSDSPAAIAAAAKEVDTLIGYRHKTLTRGTYVDRQEQKSVTAPPGAPIKVGKYTVTVPQ